MARVTGLQALGPKAGSRFIWLYAGRCTARSKGSPCFCSQFLGRTLAASSRSAGVASARSVYRNTRSWAFSAGAWGMHRVSTSR